MPLPVPSLDNRHFQDIVYQAKRLIPQYCPEWTDHNVSDPGVTLIELFASMTEMLLYRVNQVPDKLYIKFLEMIGVQLQGPQKAVAPITFYLSAAQPDDVTIPAGTEVATVRTETNPAIIFTTEQDLTLLTPTLIGLYTRNASKKEPWVQYDLRKAELGGHSIPIFPPIPGPRDAFMLALEKDHSNHILAIKLSCESASGMGVNPINPPIKWEVWQNESARWVACEVKSDSTGGFNYKEGEVILYIPAMARKEFQGVNAYWLRCALTEAQPGTGAYKVSPAIRHMHVETHGGTVWASHATTILNEVLGVSDGTPGQAFKLLHTPILKLDPQRDFLVEEPPGGEAQRWQEVTDFADSSKENRHFTLDKLDGTVTLGPSLLQPDGSVYLYGNVPEKGSILRFKRYQYGGGVVGNVKQHTLSVLKSSIPYVTAVTNRASADKGLDAQSLEDAKLHAPQKLRTRTRAVTADDYEYLACEVSGVARARCLAPGAQPGQPDDPKPGQIFVYVLPKRGSQQDRMPDWSIEMRSAVLSKLKNQCLLGTTLEVKEPQYIWISVQAKLHLSEGSDRALSETVKERAKATLRRYLDPYEGGPQGKGWPFGRALNRSEVFGLLQSIEHVEFVESVQMSIRESRDAANPPPAKDWRTIPIPRHGLICSDQHQVEVS